VTNLILRRIQSAIQTLGTLTLYEDAEQVWSCVTSELPWRNNSRRRSCIPEGTYRVRHRSASMSFSLGYDHLWIQDVQDRSAILIHAGNFLSDTAGCVLVGRAFADLDGDHVTDITDSQATLRELVGQIPRDGCPLQIKTMDVSLHALEPDTH